jgi:hypothetical protein
VAYRNFTNEFQLLLFDPVCFVPRQRMTTSVVCARVRSCVRVYVGLCVRVYVGLCVRVWGVRACVGCACV